MPLPNVKIMLHSRGTYPYYSGNAGTFGIPVSVKSDTIIISLEGFETLRQSIETNRYQFFTLKMQSATVSKVHLKLSSKTKDLLKKDHKKFLVAGESYSDLIENEFVNAARYPETGFSVNIDRASYSNIRRFINLDGRVPPDAVRIEEILN